MALKFNPLSIEGFDIDNNSGGGGGDPTIGSPVNGASAHRILKTDGSGNLDQTAALTNGQLIIGSTGASPAISTLTGTSGRINVTNGAGSITITTPLGDLVNAQELYVDSVGGSDTTGTGSVLLPLETLEEALTLTTDTTKQYVVFLSPGDYGAAPLTIPSNVSLFGKGAVISQPITIDFLAGENSAPVYDGISADDITMDMSPATIAIATFRDGTYGITRTDSTSGPFFYTVRNSSVLATDLTGTGSYSDCLFLSTCNVQNDGSLLLNNCIVGINIDVLGTGSISMTACTFPGSITGTDDGGNTPQVSADASSLGFGGTITGADVIDLDSAAYISYTPAVSGDWLVVPAKVNDALDELADRVNNLIPSGTKYNATFNATSDWGSASGGFYTITVLQTTHLVGTSPAVSLFELDSGDHVLVNVDEVRVNTSGDVSFRVPETPDLRFAGKVIIV